MQYKITITGTKPIWFGERKVLPGESAVVESSQIDRKNRHIKIERVKKQSKRREVKNGIMES